MNKLFLYLLLLTPLSISSQAIYFADGYHGGIWGHYPLWQTQFMIDKLAEFPEWKINLEIEPVTWDSVKVLTPDEYRNFQKIVSDSRIEFTNPAYGQPYLFNISGESIIRQFELGIKTLNAHFPQLTFTTYATEEPCFTSALPQILRSFGFKYAVLKNPDTCWGGYTRGFGAGLANWTGPDGTTIFTVPRYECEALEHNSTWQTIAWKNSDRFVKACIDAGIRNPIGMCYQDAGWKNGPWIGSGDEIINRSAYTTWKDYFEIASRDETPFDLHLSQEDIQVGLMWGSQILQRIAQNVRKAENKIVQAEKMLAISYIEKNALLPQNLLDEAWKSLSLAQHHDAWIVPYNRVEDTNWGGKVEEWLDITNKIADEAIDFAKNIDADNHSSADCFLTIYNTVAADRSEIICVDVPEKFANCNMKIYDSDNYLVESYIDRTGVKPLLFCKTSLPSMGYTTIKLKEDKSIISDCPSEIRYISENECVIENDMYLIKFDLKKGGTISSLVAKYLNNKEFVDSKLNYCFNEISGFFYAEGRFVSNIENPATITVMANNPLQIHLKINSEIAGNPCSQEIILNKNEPRIDFSVKIDWNGNPEIGEYRQGNNWRDNRRAFYDSRFKLKTMFPLAINNPIISKDAPFDVCKSVLPNTSYNTWDSIKNDIILNWADICEVGCEYGLALLSDHTTSYFNAEDCPLGLVLQYSGKGLWGMNYSITQPTLVKYALIPHKKSWKEARIATNSRFWSEPCIIYSSDKNISCKGKSFISFDRSGYELSCFKPTDGDIIARVVNWESGSEAVKINFGFPVGSCKEIKLNGEPIRECPVNGNAVEIALPQFGISTLKITKK